jgi:hypothetical protein
MASARLIDEEFSCAERKKGKGVLRAWQKF